MDLRELYQEVILDHSKRPRNFRALPDANRRAEGHNPLCGDRATVYLRVEDDVEQFAAPVEVGHAVFLALREVLGAEEAALVEHDHVPAALGEVYAEGAAAGAGAYDHDVARLADFALPVRALDDHATSP